MIIDHAHVNICGQEKIWIWQLLHQRCVWLRLSLDFLAWALTDGRWWWDSSRWEGCACDQHQATARGSKVYFSTVFLSCIFELYLWTDQEDSSARGDEATRCRCQLDAETRCDCSSNFFGCRQHLVFGNNAVALILLLNEWKIHRGLVSWHLMTAQLQPWLATLKKHEQVLDFILVLGCFLVKTASIIKTTKVVGHLCMHAVFFQIQVVSCTWIQQCDFFTVFINCKILLLKPVD